MATMATAEEPQADASAPRLPILPFGDNRAVIEAIVDKGASTDRLPVVELRPFMNQEWRPSRSVPDFYDRVASSMSNGSNRRGDGGSGYPDPAQLGLVNQKGAEFGSRNSLLNERNALRTQRLREGKPVNTSHDGMFVTTIDREQTTIHDMQVKSINKAGPNMQTASIVRSLSDGEMLRLRQMNVQGRKVENLPPKLNMIYMSAWEYYRMNRTYQIPISDSRAITAAAQPGVAGENAAATIDDLENRCQAMDNVAIDDNIYDTFDRSNTLPSIRVTNAPMRRKRSKRQPSAVSSSAPGSGKNPAYRLGVANSLDVLRHFGKPARVESHLTMHLKHTLNQLRRSQDSQATLQSLASSAGVVGGPSGGMTPGRPLGLRSSSTPTYGESMIRAGIEANNRRITDRNIRADLPSQSAPEVLARTPTQGNADIYSMLNRFDPVPDDDPMASARSFLENNAIYEDPTQQPNTPPSSAELINDQVAGEQESRVGTTSRKSTRRKEPKDPNSPHDQASSSSSTTKSPRTKSRRSKSRRSKEALSEEATSAPRSSPVADHGVLVSPTREGGQSVTFRDDEQLLPRSAPTSPGPSPPGGATPTPTGRTSILTASRAESRKSVQIPQPPDNDSSTPTPQEPVQSGDNDQISESVEMGPNGDIQIAGKPVGVIQIGADGTLTLGGKTLGVIKVGATGELEIGSSMGLADLHAAQDIANSSIGGATPAAVSGNSPDAVENSADYIETNVQGSSGSGAQQNAQEGNTGENAPVKNAPDSTAENAPTSQTPANGENHSVSDNQISDDNQTTGDNQGDSVAHSDIEINVNNDNKSPTNMEVDPSATESTPTQSENTQIGGISSITVSEDGTMKLGDKNLGSVEFGNRGEIKIGGKVIGALSADAEGNVGITAGVGGPVQGSRQGTMASMPPRGETIYTSGAPSETGVSLPGGAPTPGDNAQFTPGQELTGGEPSSDLNNNTSEATPAHNTPGGQKPLGGGTTPGGSHLTGGEPGGEESHPEGDEGGFGGTVAMPGGGSKTPGGGEPAAPCAPTPGGGFAPTPVPGDAQHPPGGDLRRANTKSAASKASSQGYRGEAVYITSWDQKTETESVRPETVLTVREEGDEE